jgi:hypothetical protein
MSDGHSEVGRDLDIVDRETVGKLASTAFVTQELLGIWYSRARIAPKRCD